MGALHDGHASLIEEEDMGPDGHVVVSIYVNPTQFNDPEDFEAYPSTREADMAVARDAGADAVVFPNADELYRGVPEQAEATDYGSLTALWEAAHRPGPSTVWWPWCGGCSPWFDRTGHSSAKRTGSNWPSFPSWCAGSSTVWRARLP